MGLGGFIGLSVYRCRPNFWTGHAGTMVNETWDIAQKNKNTSLHLSHFFFCRSRRMRKTYSVSMANEQFVKVHCNNALPMNSIGVELWQHVGEPIRRWNGSHPSNNYHMGWRGHMGRAWYCSNRWWFVFDPPSGTAKELHLFFLICWPFSRGKWSIQPAHLLIH